MNLATDVPLHSEGATPMARSRAQKRAVRKRRQATQLAAAAPPARHATASRGRPKEPRDVGPTVETARKLKPNTLNELRAMKVDGEPFLTADLVEAGEEIHRTWVIITAGSGFKSHAGGSSVDSNDSKRLQATWRRWCAEDATGRPFNELFRRCFVRPAIVVQWINPTLFGEGAGGCDRDPKGAAGVLRRALEWWRLAARDVARAR